MFATKDPANSALKETQEHTSGAELLRSSIYKSPSHLRTYNLNFKGELELNFKKQGISGIFAKEAWVPISLFKILPLLLGKHVVTYRPTIVTPEHRDSNSNSVLVSSTLCLPTNNSYIRAREKKSLS